MPRIYEPVSTRPALFELFPVHSRASGKRTTRFTCLAFLSRLPPVAWFTWVFSLKITHMESAWLGLLGWFPFRNTHVMVSAWQFTWAVPFEKYPCYGKCVTVYVGGSLWEIPILWQLRDSLLAWFPFRITRYSRIACEQLATPSPRLSPPHSPPFPPPPIPPSPLGK